MNRPCASCPHKDLTAILPGTGANPFFDGRNVTRFLERFERLQELYYPVEDDFDRIERLCQNVADDIAPRIQYLAKKHEGFWESFATQLHRVYRDQDPMQMKASRAYLEELSSVPHSEPKEVLDYYYEFTTASDLIPAGDLDGPTRVSIFLQEMASRWFQAVARGPGAITAAQFDEAMSMCIKTLERVADDEEAPRKRRRLQ